MFIFLLETILLEGDDNSIDPDRISAVDAEPSQINQPDIGSEQTETETIQDDTFSESMKILQQHGITMLPTDDTSILSSVMENGHSVVLTGNVNFYKEYIIKYEKKICIKKYLFRCR